MEVSEEDKRALIRDKYDGDAGADITDDLERLQAGEPLAYVIGWVPFLGLRVNLSSHPLIPRVETEWWAEELLKDLKKRYGNNPFTLLDLCAGSGAIGLAILNAFPEARVSFGEIDAEHAEQIAENIRLNHLDVSRADIRTGDLFEPFVGMRFDVIATNPPYVPSGRELPESVIDFEPHGALFAGSDGLSVISRIAKEFREHLTPSGVLWIECDTEHADEVRSLLGEQAAIHQDQYGRPRFVVSY